MKNTTTSNTPTFEQLPQVVAKVCDEISAIRDQLSNLQKNFAPKEPTEYLTRREVASLLKCDLSTVHNWTKSGRLIPYGLGNRVYYKRSEVETALVSLSIKKGGAEQ